MEKHKLLRGAALFCALASAGTLFGCSHYEVNTGRGNIPGHYIRYEMQEADRAIEAARAAGKDQSCPAEFQQAEAAKADAYDVFRACRTEEGAALAKGATAKAKALCPPKIAQLATRPVPPTDKLTITPGSISSGGTATLSWTSTNAKICAIEPSIGMVQPEGSLTVMPQNSAVYTLVCSGAGGTAKSEAGIHVMPPPPVPVAVAPLQVVLPEAAAAKLCSPAVIDVRFDTNRAEIKQVYHDELKALGAFLAEFPEATGVIEGHTDSVGNKAANLKLSQRRADSVRNYLIKNFGVTPERIKAVGYGPARPIADNGSASGKQKNRRIESNFACN